MLGERLAPHRVDVLECLTFQTTAAVNEPGSHSADPTQRQVSFHPLPSAPFTPLRTHEARPLSAVLLCITASVCLAAE